MGTLRDDLAADYAEAIGDYEQTFEWKGNTVPCIRTTAPAGVDDDPGGQELQASDRITVAIADLPKGKWPAQGDLVDRNTLQILKDDLNVGHLVLWCGPLLNLRAGSGD